MSESNRCFYSHAGSNPFEGSTLTMDGFLNALAAVGLIKYPREGPPRALRRLVDEFLLPYATLLGGHSAAAARAAAPQGVLVTQGSTVAQVRDFVISSGNAEALSSIFTSYSTPHNQHGDRIDSKHFLELCRDAKLFDDVDEPIGGGPGAGGAAGLGVDEAGSIYMGAAKHDDGSAGCGGAGSAMWLYPDVFLHVLTELADCKFPHQEPYNAAVRLIVGYVLPYADRLQ